MAWKKMIKKLFIIIYMYYYCQKIKNFFVLLKDVAVEIGKYDLEKGIKWDDYY